MIEVQTTLVAGVGNHQDIGNINGLGGDEQIMPGVSV